VATVRRNGRDFLAPVGDANSFVSWEVEHSAEGKHAYIDANLTMADCYRRITLSFNDLKDLAKLDILREHLDRFERETRKALKAVSEAKKAAV
jgi:hypothetical protein